MHRGANRNVTTAARPLGDGRARRQLRAAAVLLNLALFAVGLYFQAHPRDRHDVWAAGGVAAAAILSSAALTLPVRPGFTARLVPRLRRIALFVNALLLTAAAAIAVVTAFRDARDALQHGAALVVPPLVTVAALRQLPPP